ncbi:MAG: PaaR repeat-containing protein [Gammaproteobacteria bacterium]|nr:MAG: PaaR repeat-containing protein [Gammaproteobacteria bacterium]
MAKVARQGDSCTGHGCWPSRSSTSGSPNVFVNGLPAFRQGDSWAAHTCPIIPNTHGSSQAGGSNSVFVNGRPLARVGDAVACGGSIATGSSNVYAGG